jgi:hypothetical protein
MNVYLEALQAWGHASANNAGWPEFDGKNLMANSSTTSSSRRSGGLIGGHITR